MTDQNDLIYITVAVENVENKFLALRQSVAELHDQDGKKVASITTTAGLGGDAVFLEWKGRVGIVRMSQLLRNWVNSFDAEGGRRLPHTGPPDHPNAPEPPKVEDPETRERLVDRIADLGKEDQL